MPDSLRQYRMLFERVPDGEAVHADDLGGMSKLGGKPDWVQAHDETPTCPKCGKPMAFVGQIDSIEHDVPNNPHRIDCLSRDQQYMFGDVGMLYVFFCFDCLRPETVFQCG